MKRKRDLSKLLDDLDSRQWFKRVTPENPNHKITVWTSVNPYNNWCDGVTCDDIEDSSLAKYGSLGVAAAALFVSWLGSGCSDAEIASRFKSHSPQQRIERSADNQELEATLRDRKYQEDNKKDNLGLSGPDPNKTVSRQELETVLAKFGYDFAQDKKFEDYYSPDEFILTQEEIDSLSRREIFRGFKILASLYEKLPNKVQSMREQRKMLKRYVNSDYGSDFFLESIGILTNNQAGKLKRLFSYIETRGSEEVLLLSVLGGIGDAFRKPKIMDEFEERREPVRKEIRKRFEQFTTDDMFNLYDAYDSLGIKIFTIGNIQSYIGSKTRFGRAAGIDCSAHESFMNEYGFNAEVNPELKEKISRFAPHLFGEWKCRGKYIDFIDKTPTEFLKILIRAGSPTDSDDHFKILEKLGENREFLCYLNSTLSGGLNATLSENIEKYWNSVLSIAENGGREYVDAYMACVRERKRLPNEELKVLEELIPHGGTKFLRELISNSNNDLDNLERRALPAIASNPSLKDFSTKDPLAKYIFTEKETIEWFLGNRDKLDEKLIKEVYENHGKLSRFDMALLGAMSQDSELLKSYRNRHELEAFAAKIYSQPANIATYHGKEWTEKDERADIKSLSSLDLLRMKIIYKALRSDEGRAFVGDLAYRDVEEYTKDGSKFESELPFAIYYHNGKAFFLAEEPEVNKWRVSFGKGIISDRKIEVPDNRKCIRPAPVEKEGYFPIALGHTHITTKDDSKFSVPSGLRIAREYGQFLSDMGNPHERHITGVVLTSLGMQEGSPKPTMKIGTDMYMVRKGRAVNSDLSSFTVLYQKAVEKK